MDPEPLSPQDARAALDGVDAVRRMLALEATSYPVWRHAAFAAIMATLALSLGLDLPLQLLATAAALGAMFWLAADDRRRYGLFINGYRKGATLPVSVALLAAMLGAVAAQVSAHIRGAPLLVKLAIAAVVFIVALETSYAWNRAYRRELLDNAG